MAPLISFLKIVFLNSIIYENCLTDIEEDCRYTDFQIVGVSNATTDRCGSDPKNLYMGSYGFQTTVSKNFPMIPPNHGIEFKVGIWKFDSWDAEGFEIWANDQLIENLILNVFDGTNICRNEIFPEILIHFTLKFDITEQDLTTINQYLLKGIFNKFIYYIIQLLIININQQEISEDYLINCITFKDHLNTLDNEVDLWDESWGFRDMILRLPIPCVNFYSECNYLGNLFQICKGEQSKFQNDIPFEIKSIFLGPNIIVQLKGPNYFGGILQEFTSSEPCLDSYSQSKTYKFPKQDQQE